MVKTAIAPKEEIWERFGIHTSVREKNTLIERIMRESETRDLDFVVGEWFYSGIVNLSQETINLLQKIVSICSDLSIYYSPSQSGNHEILAITETFDGEVFDKITDCVIEYECVSHSEISYYYVAKKDLKSVPQHMRAYTKM